MKVNRIICALCVVFLVTGIVSAQGEHEPELKKVIGTFFKGLQNGDTLMIKRTITDTAILQTTYTNKEGEAILKTEDFHKFLKSIASKKVEDHWEEKLLSYTIKVDGNMANVWTPYKFYLNYKFSHCGVNSFQLFHDGESWKIIYLIDTRRRLGCIE